MISKLKTLKLTQKGKKFTLKQSTGLLHLSEQMFCNLGEGQTIKEIACKKAQTIYREEEKENWKKKLQSSR